MFEITGIERCERKSILFLKPLAHKQNIQNLTIDKKYMLLAINGNEW